MIRLGLRLTLATGREAVVRLVLITLAVALGTGLLLIVLAGANAVPAQNARFGWLNTAAVGAPATAPADPMWWALRQDYFHGAVIGRVDVAALGPHTAVPPGVPRLPGPGEYYASPALAALLRSTPPAQLGDRFPGREIGTIGAAALPSPDSLLILIGRAPAEVASLPHVAQVTAIVTADPGSCNECYVGIPARGINLVLGVVVVALLFPVLIFIGTATRLSAARREQRFAAMRLVGATPRQISVVSAVESGAAAVAGTLLGFVLFLAARPALAGIPFTGDRFFPADLTLTVPGVLAVALGVPLGAVLAARLALRRVRISPLGVTRRVPPKPPSAWRLAPLAVGLAELGYFVGRRPESTNGQLTAYLGGIFLVLAGLMTAGPWCTMLGSRALARRAGRAATLIAGRRLADDPRAAFRAVSGLIIALFVASVATGVISTFVANRGAPQAGSLSRTTLSMIIWPGQYAPGAGVPQTAQIPAGLRALPGVTSVTVVRANPDGDRPGVQPGVIACRDLPAQFGSCPPGAQVAGVYPDLLAADGLRQAADFAASIWPAVPVSSADLRQLPLLSVVVATDGSTAALETSRTMLEAAFPGLARPPATGVDFEADSTRSLFRFKQLANVVILVSLPIAGCSLAVSVAGGLTDRKRPFSMLRLTGVRLAELRQVVLLEAGVPLLAGVALAIGAGFLAAELFLRSQLGYTLVSPGLTYVLLVAAGLVTSIGIIASTMPLLRRITGPETARNE